TLRQSASSRTCTLIVARAPSSTLTTPSTPSDTPASLLATFEAAPVLRPAPASSLSTRSPRPTSRVIPIRRSTRCPTLTKTRIQIPTTHNRYQSRIAIELPEKINLAQALQLETPRLKLRRWRDADREPFAAMNADPIVMHFFAAPMTREQSDEAIDRYLTAFDREGFTFFAATMS